MAATLGATLSGDQATIIVRQYLKYTMPNLVMGKLVVDANKWAGAAMYGTVIQIPTHLTRLGVTQLNTGLSGQGAETDPPSITFTAATSGNVQVTIDQWWYSAFQITVFAEATTALDWRNILRTSASDSLAVKIDATLTNLLGSHDTSYGEDNTPLAVQDLIDTMGSLDAGDVPTEDRHFVISAGEKANWVNHDVIINQLYVGGDGGKPVTNGQLGRPVYGFTPHVTTNLTAGTAGKKSGGFQRNAYAKAMRRTPFAMVLDNPNTASHELAMFAIWGIKELRDGFGVSLFGK